MAAPRLSPLLLVSDLVGYVNYKSTDADAATRLRGAIDRATHELTVQTARRFDIRQETRRYSALSVERGGGLMSPRELYLADDLISVSSITNGDLSSITSGYTLLPANRNSHGILAYSTIRLDAIGAAVWTAGIYDPVAAIQIAGLWGYGGEWDSLGITLNGGINDSVTALTSSAALEAGMTIKIDSEIFYVSAVSGTAATVSRAYQGSTAAAHSNGAAMYKMQPAPLVQELCSRVVTIGLERAKSPLFQTIQAGDSVFPVDVTVSLGDVKDKIAALRRRNWIGAV